MEMRALLCEWHGVNHNKYADKCLVCIPERCYNAYKHKFLHLKPFGFRQDSMSPVLSDVFSELYAEFFFTQLPNNHYYSNIIAVIGRSV